MLLPVEIQRYLAQVVVFEVERITFQMTVECPIVHESDHEASGQLTGKQFLVTDVPIVLRHCKRFTHHAANGTQSLSIALTLLSVSSTT